MSRRSSGEEMVEMSVPAGKEKVFVESFDVGCLCFFSDKDFLCANVVSCGGWWTQCGGNLLRRHISTTNLGHLK